MCDNSKCKFWQVTMSHPHLLKTLVIIRIIIISVPACATRVFSPVPRPVAGQPALSWVEGPAADSVAPRHATQSSLDDLGGLGGETGNHELIVSSLQLPGAIGIDKLELQYLE